MALKLSSNLLCPDSIVVEHFTHNPKIKHSNTATSTRKEKMADYSGKFHINFLQAFLGYMGYIVLKLVFYSSETRMLNKNSNLVTSLGVATCVIVILKYVAAPKGVIKLVFCSTNWPLHCKKLA